MARNQLKTIVSVRFTEDEAELLRARADEAGESVSRFVRRAALNRLSPDRSVDRAARTTTSSTSSSMVTLGADAPVQIPSGQPIRVAPAG
jgi:hypothetical protein